MFYYNCIIIYRRKMAYCCQPYSLHCLSWIFTGLRGWSFISQCLMSFEISWWSALPPLPRARRRTGEWKVLISIHSFAQRILNHTNASPKFTQICKAGRTSWEKLPVGEDAVHTARCHASAKTSAKGINVFCALTYYSLVLKWQIHFKIYQYTDTFQSLFCRSFQP